MREAGLEIVRLGRNVEFVNMCGSYKIAGRMDYGAGLCVGIRLDMSSMKVRCF